MSLPGSIARLVVAPPVLRGVPRKLDLTWQTLRHLRPIQIYGRAWFRVYRPSVDTRPAPRRRTAAGRWSPCSREPRQIGPATFRFLEREETLRRAEDWNRSDWPKLWLYNIHYFEDLTADGAPQRTGWHRALIERWMRENPSGRGTGWEPYPTSLRVVQWIQWLLSGNEPVPGMLDSLASQVRYLRRRLEYHLLGNHLWANLKALLFAGAFFEGPEADRWRAYARVSFARELLEQILPDGGHFERSPMYHSLLLQDLLDLVQLSQRYPALFSMAEQREWRGAARRMRRWLQVMTHPDGQIAFFNDAAQGIAARPSALTAYAEALGVDRTTEPLRSIEPLPDSGYVRLQAGEAVLFAEVGSIAPDYLPGHAHASTLSFELSLAGQRLLVNGGTSTYESGEQRTRERSTAFHNTVVVDGVDSSEVWASFRVARRARVHAVRWSEPAPGQLDLRATHDGYERLPGRVLHHRNWVLTESGLQVHDRLEGSYSQAQARFRFAPAWQPESAEAAVFQSPAERLEVRWNSGRGTAQLEAGTWHPRFGISVPVYVLSVPLEEHEAITQFRWV